MKSPLAALPTPSEMIAHLDRFVQGQARAKRDIAVAVYEHYFSLGSRDRGGADLGRKHILMLGPTGSGKTYIVKTLADFLGVPVGFASATSLVETGYVGSPVESVIRALLDRAGGDPRKAERGIVFIDEIDKIRRNKGGGKDVSGEGVQNGLLTLMDGRISKGPDNHTHPPVDTSRLLFICTGAFVDLEEIIRKRVGGEKSQIGFDPDHDGLPGVSARDASTDAIFSRVETRDLTAFGLIPELVGRFATITALEELDEQALRTILTSMEGSPLAQQRQMAALHGIDLVYDGEAVAAVARKAAEMKTGARALARIIGRSLDAVDWRWPELADTGVTRVVVTRETVEQGAPPREEKSERAARGREDAAIRQEVMAGVRPIRPVYPEKAAREDTPASGTPPGITDARGWSDEEIWNRVEQLKETDLGWNECAEGARTWWGAFEQENRHRPALVLRLAEELAVRKAGITEFFLSYVYSNTDNIHANLHYLDYQRLKKQEDEGKKPHPAPEKPKI
jgi:ATP-dependent Clp protease ATP-binding subunit ClpX